MRITPNPDLRSAHRLRSLPSRDDSTLPSTSTGRVVAALADGLADAPGGAWRSLKAMGASALEHPVATGATLIGTMALSAAMPVAGTVMVAAGFAFSAVSVVSHLKQSVQTARGAVTAEDMQRAAREAADAYGEVLLNAAMVVGPMAVGERVSAKAGAYVSTVRDQIKAAPKPRPVAPEEALIKALEPLAQASPRDLLTDLLEVAETLSPEKRQALLSLSVRPDFLAADPATKLVKTVETLGPAFTKLTQVAADAEGIPPQLAKVLKSTQDALTPMSKEALSAVLGQEAQNATDVARGIYRIGGRRYELGKTLGVASVGEVHLVKDLESSQTMVLKIRKPAANPESINQEFELMDSLVRFWAKHGKVSDNQLNQTLKNLESFRTGVLEEIDMTHELKNAQRFASLYADQPFAGITARYASPKGNLLLMDKAEGLPFTKLSTLPPADREAALLAYMRGLYKQMGTGYFHADPHPGNVFWNPETRAVQFLDMGAMAEITPAERVKLFEMIGISLTRNPDQMARYLIRNAEQITSKLPPEQLQAELGQALQKFFQRGGEVMDPNKDALEIARIAQEFGVFPRDNGFWFTKTMITIGNVTRGPVGDRWLQELVPPMAKAVAEAARTEPVMVKDTVVNLARSIRQSPSGFARSIIQLTNAQPEMFGTLPIALVKVLNELAAPMRIGHGLGERAESHQGKLPAA